MIICICNNVTENDIEQAIDNGAMSMAQISRKTELGTGCGGCLQNAKAILEGRLAELISQRPDQFYAA